MSGSAREELIEKVVEKHGRDAEAPAREVAQVYEDELRRVESQYKDLEQAAVNQDLRSANNFKLIVVTYLFLGLSLGILAATFATYDLSIDSFVLYLFGGILSGIGVLLSFMT